VRALQTWPDEHAFLAEDVRRQRSDEVDLGATWRADGSNDTWRLAWLRDTGELYVCRNDSLVGGGTSVHLLAVLADEHAVDALLPDWRVARDGEDGLGWLEARVGQPAAA
jgi:hypothetical protein